MDIDVNKQLGRMIVYYFILIIYLFIHSIINFKLKSIRRFVNARLICAIAIQFPVFL